MLIPCLSGHPCILPGCLHAASLSLTWTHAASQPPVYLPSGCLLSHCTSLAIGYHHKPVTLYNLSAAIPTLLCLWSPQTSWPPPISSSAYQQLPICLPTCLRKHLGLAPFCLLWLLNTDRKLQGDIYLTTNDPHLTIVLQKVPQGLPLAKWWSPMTSCFMTKSLSTGNSSPNCGHILRTTCREILRKVVFVGVFFFKKRKREVEIKTKGVR